VSLQVLIEAGQDVRRNIVDRYLRSGDEFRVELGEVANEEVGEFGGELDAGRAAPDDAKVQQPLLLRLGDIGQRSLFEATEDAIADLDGIVYRFEEDGMVSSALSPCPREFAYLSQGTDRGCLPKSAVSQPVATTRTS
jgi:hypothetical protein